MKKQNDVIMSAAQFVGIFRFLSKRIGRVNRMARAASRQRLGLRRASGAFCQCPESGRGLPQSKTWRSFSSPSQISARSFDERFMERLLTSKNPFRIGQWETTSTNL
jgi:hypothetical protein